MPPDTTAPAGDGPNCDILIAALLDLLEDGLDHPELWPCFTEVLAAAPTLPAAVEARLVVEAGGEAHDRLLLLLVMCAAAGGDLEAAQARLEPLAVQRSESVQVQGAAFYIRGLLAPDDSRFHLVGKVCEAPFIQLDVLERSTHLCCASWLPTSVGSLADTPWEQVWNSKGAEAVRASVHDGSYRHCNKTACPRIAGNQLVPAAEMAVRSPFWRDVVTQRSTLLPAGPDRVNLAYDRTCNLSCPSCRTEVWAADENTRERFATMQEREILPLLRTARTVFVTGSGDPFASKNFRRLMRQLTAADYPALRFLLMTNGMLLTPRQWESFPALRGRTALLKISIDAATGPTHERLRRGARWQTMLENLAFAGRLAAAGEVAQLDLIFTVQADNFHEMGAAVDLAKQVGATGIYFGRITNWGTFTDDEYRARAVFQPSHPDFAAFVHHMQDDRLQDPMVLLGNLTEFVAAGAPDQRVFVA